MDLGDPKFSRGSRKTVAGLPQGVAQQEAFECPLGFLPSRQLIAVKHEAVVVGEHDLLFVLCRNAVELVTKPRIVYLVEQLADSREL